LFLKISYYKLETAVFCCIIIWREKVSVFTLRTNVRVTSRGSALHNEEFVSDKSHHVREVCTTPWSLFCFSHGTFSNITVQTCEVPVFATPAQIRSLVLYLSDLGLMQTVNGDSSLDVLIKTQMFCKKRITMPKTSLVTCSLFFCYSHSLLYGTPLMRS
jgi:hypothetical protein